MTRLRKSVLSLRACLLITLQSCAVLAIPASQIFARQNSCKAKGLLQCPDSLPDNFCCPTGSTCVVLAGATSAICCPQGRDCGFIQPITCDVSRQDPDKFPKAPIKTSVFDVNMAKCGPDTCCPFGFSCSPGGLCQKNADQSKSPRDANPTASPSTTAKPTSTISPTATGIISSSASATVSEPDPTSVPTLTPPGDDSDSGSSGDSDSGSDSEPDSSSDASKPASASTTSIIGGIVGGCLVLIIIAVVIFLYIRRNNRRDIVELESTRPQMRHRPTGSRSGPGIGGPIGTVISGPISQPGSYRTDFMLRPASNQSRPSPGNANERRTASKLRSGLFPRISIPNPFTSPTPSTHSPSATGSRVSTASSSPEDQVPRTGHVAGAKLAPIRAMRASSKFTHRSTQPHLHHEPSSEDINVFADPSAVKGENAANGGGGRGGDQRLTRGTTFTELMDQADLGDVRRGKPYVPGTTPRI